MTGLVKPERINPMVRVWGSGPADTRCSSCAEFKRKAFNGRSYFKCSYRGDTNGRGSDHRASWPACARYTPDSREVGISQAVDSAERIHPGWCDQAFQYLKAFILDSTAPFMAEDVREAAEGAVPSPPSLRAWGAVMIRAAKEGLIKRAGHQNVRNERAHKTPATLWIPTHVKQ